MSNHELGELLVGLLSFVLGHALGRVTARRPGELRWRERARRRLEAFMLRRRRARLLLELPVGTRVRIESCRCMQGP